jgi:hypothetical protein
MTDDTRHISDEDARAIAREIAATDPVARREAAKRDLNAGIRGSLRTQRERRFARLSRPVPAETPASAELQRLNAAREKADREAATPSTRPRSL